MRRSAVELELGRVSDAIADASRALDLSQQASVPASFSNNLGYAYLALGRGLQAQGKQGEARAAFRSAAQHLERSIGADHPDTRTARRLADPNSPRS